MTVDRTLLVFHVHGCPACLKHIPNLEAMRDELLHSGVQLNIVDARSHMDKARALGVDAVPSAFVVNNTSGCITPFGSVPTASVVRHEFLRNASTELTARMSRKLQKKCTDKNVRAIVLCAPPDHPAHAAWRAHCAQHAAARSLVRMHAFSPDALIADERCAHATIVSPTQTQKALDESDLTRASIFERLEKLSQHIP